MRMSKETVQRVEGTRKRFQGYLLVVSVARVAARRPPRPWRGGRSGCGILAVLVTYAPHSSRLALKFWDG